MRIAYVDFLSSRFFVEGFVYNNKIRIFAKNASQVLDALPLRFYGDYLAPNLKEGLRTITHIGSDVEANMAWFEKLRIEGRPYCFLLKCLSLASSGFLCFPMQTIEFLDEIQVMLQFHILRRQFRSIIPSAVEPTTSWRFDPVQRVEVIVIFVKLVRCSLLQ